MVTGPRWSQDRWISPTTLRNYLNCALRVRLKHLDLIPEPFVYNLFLAKGRIAHGILGYIASALNRGLVPVDDDAVLKMASLRLPRQNFPSEEQRMAEARDILRWVNVGRHYLEAILDPGWVLIERTLHRPLRIAPRAPAYTLMARPDVIVERRDLGEETVFEIIDYKTGKRRPNIMPAVIMRYVAWDLLRGYIGNASAARVQFTWLWLNTGERDVRDLSVEFCTEAWNDILVDLEQLTTEQAWPPRPSSLCNYCPYFGSVCTEQIPYEDGLGR